MKLPPHAEISLWETSFFLFIVALFLFVSSKAGMRGLGIAVIIGAISMLITKRMAYGWKGHEPSGWISGITAILLGVLQGAAGILMLLQPELILTILEGMHK